jgi:hypothetical protein
MTTYRGRVTNGAVVLQEGASLPEGSEVLVLPVPARDAAEGAADAGPNGDSVWLRLLELSGTATGLPADLPERHDDSEPAARAARLITALGTARNLEPIGTLPAPTSMTATSFVDTNVRSALGEVLSAR